MGTTRHKFSRVAEKRKLRECFGQLVRGIFLRFLTHFSFSSNTPLASCLPLMNELTEDRTRLAVIDVGPSSLRFLAAELAPAEDYRVLDSGWVPLGHERDSLPSDRTRADSRVRALGTLGEFRSHLAALGIRHYRAVAANAMGMSRGEPSFVDRVGRQLGLQVEIISNTERSRLLFQAVRSRVPLDEGDWILVDLDGENFELSLINQASILRTETQSLGPLRRLAEYREAGFEDDERLGRLLADCGTSLHLPVAATRRALSGLIAVGSTVEALALLAMAAERWPGTAVLTRERLQEVTEQLAQIAFKRPIEELRLHQTRAETLLPAAVLCSRLLQDTGVPELIIPFVGVKEGLMEDMVRRISAEQMDGGRSPQVWDAAVDLGRRYQFEEPHALQVGRIAISLFDQLAAPLGLDPGDRPLLIVASILHDVGTVVSYNKHHRHSFYLIAQSELAGFTAHESLLAGLIARYHRKSAPSMKHSQFSRLDERDRKRVLKLASLLRLADSLDRDHVQRIEEVHAAVENGALALEANGSGDMLLETWSLEKKSKLFARAFGLSVKLVRVSHPGDTVANGHQNGDD